MIVQAILLLFILTSCEYSPPLPSTNSQLFSGRNDEHSLERPFLYRADVPFNWIRHDPPLEESLADTMKSICEFYIHENDNHIRITLHTFPLTQENRSIPPQAQIARWKKQFDELDELSIQIHPESHGGFHGLYFEAEGILQSQPTKVIGWTMQLATIYEQHLNQNKHPLDLHKRADYTIKATGPPALMNKHRLPILAFAHSFELIDELPPP